MTILSLVCQPFYTMIFHAGILCAPMAMHTHLDLWYDIYKGHMLSVCMYSKREETRIKFSKFFKVTQINVLQKFRSTMEI